MAVDFSQVGQPALDLATLQQERSQSANANRAQQQDETSGVNASVAQALQPELASLSPISVNDSQQVADTETVVQEEVSSAVNDIQEFLQNSQRSLNFSFNEDARRSVVSVTDVDTGDVIRQIPSEEVLQLAERIRELQSDVGSAVGVFFNREV